MKKVYYHGTSADNLDSILENGILCEEPKIWGCSADGVYLWEPDAVAEADCMEDEDEEYKHERAFQMATESGQLACAYAKDCRVVVLKIVLDSEEVRVDDSCNNMEHANVIYRDILPHEIQEVKVSCDLSLIKGYFIAIMLRMDLSDKSFSSIENKIGEAFSKMEIYPEDIDDLIEWTTLNTLQEA